MRATWGGAHRYVLAPSTASARVRRERCEQPLRERDRPRLAAHLTLDLVQLRLSEVTARCRDLGTGLRLHFIRVYYGRNYISPCKNAYS